MLIKLKLTPKINKVTIKAKEQTKQTDRRLLLIGNFKYNKLRPRQ